MVYVTDFRSWGPSMSPVLSGVEGTTSQQPLV